MFRGKWEENSNDTHRSTIIKIATRLYLAYDFFILLSPISYNLFLSYALISDIITPPPHIQMVKHIKNIAVS